MSEKSQRIPVEAFSISKNNNLSLQEQLTSALVELLLNMQSPPGTRLPSTRALAKHLGISRLTVTIVYADLASQDYIESHPRSGYVVSQSIPERVRNAGKGANREHDVDWDDFLSEGPAHPRVITKPDDWRSYQYPFIYGQPDFHIFQSAVWRDCARRALGARDYAMMADDQMTKDDPMLIDYILRNTLARRGIQAQPDEVLITIGAQNALYVTVNMMAKATGLGVIEDPGYPDFAMAFRSAGVRYVTAPVDHEGIVAARIPQEATLVCTTPSHHIPTGASMSLARRSELLDRADRDNFLIIEDDYETEMTWESAPLPPLKALDRKGRVIYIGSFSKTLFPGLRIGFLVASAEFIRKARQMRTVMLRHPPGLLQRITAYFHALGHYDTHLQRLRSRMATRRAVLIEALEASPFVFASSAAYGASSLWMRTPDGLPARVLAENAQRQGVLIEPGAPFFEYPSPNTPYFRLGYSSIARRNIRDGIDTLASTWSAP